MSRKKVPYDDAVARAREAGFEAAFPEEEWKGTHVNGKNVTHPWTHVECGETRPQEFHRMLKGSCGGCHSRGRKKMTYDEAVERARAAGFEAAFSTDEWKGTQVNGKNVTHPWTHVECGETRLQQFGSMLKGTCGGCHSRGGKKMTYDEVVERARKAGFEPAFPGDEWQGTAGTNRYLWTHLECGETRPQQFYSMLKGTCGGCRPRGRKKMTYDEVVARAREAGFTPAFSTDEWQGASVNGKQTKCLWTHLECGETRSQQFHSMLKGTCGRCGPASMKAPYDDAVARARERLLDTAKSKVAE